LRLLGNNLRLEEARHAKRFEDELADSRQQRDELAARLKAAEQEAAGSRRHGEEAEHRLREMAAQLGRVKLELDKQAEARRRLESELNQRLEGTKAAAQQADQDLKNTWAEVIGRFSQGNFLHANLLHADPHPGNYRFNSDGTVGFLDFGCVKVLPELQRWRLVAMTRAIVEGRKHDYRDLMVQAGFLAAGSYLTADELYQWQSEILYETIVMPQPATYTPEMTRRVIRGIFDLRGADHPMARMNAPDDFVFASPSPSPSAASPPVCARPCRPGPW